jgi:hypothetical protein
MPTSELLTLQVICEEVLGSTPSYFKPEEILAEMPADEAA